MIFWNSHFFDNPMDVGNLISSSSAFSKTSLNIWKFSQYLLLKRLSSLHYMFLTLLLKIDWMQMCEFIIFVISLLCSIDLNVYLEVMEFQLSYLKSWKMMLWKCCTQYVSKFGKLSSGHRTGKGHFSFQPQRKAMPKNAQTTAQLHSSHMLAK